jgi:hypothetical protein
MFTRCNVDGLHVWHNRRTLLQDAQNGHPVLRPSKGRPQGVKGRGGHSAEVCCGAERGENGAGGLFQHPLKIRGWSYKQLRGGMRSGS